MWDKQSIDYSLYLVTDRKLCVGDFFHSLQQAIAGGVTIVQLREKELSTREFYELGMKVLSMTTSHNIPLIINDRLDVALAIGATGVHLGQNDLPANIARQLLGPEKILGVSTNNLDEALEAQKQGADYVGVGAVFSTQTKTDTRSITLAQVEEMKKRTSIPVLAIGGINSENAHKVLQSGIDGICVASAILGKEDPRHEAQKLRAVLNRKVME